jgi:CopA family copper-resistance protein
MTSEMSRRTFLKNAVSTAASGLFVTSLASVFPSPAWSQADHSRSDLTKSRPKDKYDLEIGYEPMKLNGQTEPVKATAINGSVPGPPVHLKQGDRVNLNVTNALWDSKHSSIHWHGILVPSEMDGVPGVSFKGVPPGDTYHYEYDVVQSGTYWYHSHSFFQEQTGTYGPLIVEPQGDKPFDYDRDYVVMLSDWTSDGPEDAYRNLKLGEGYYNYQKQTVWDILDDVRQEGLHDTMGERMAWGQMRMSPVDLAAITGAEFTYLMNGNSPDMNWTGLFNPGETVRLRFINSSAMSTFDVRIPGLEMEVVMADGKPVEPTSIEEFRLSVAETLDVLVTPKEERPFTIFAESLDRSGYARGTLSPKKGLEAPVPDQRKRPVRKLEEIGMGGMDEMIIGGTKEMSEWKRHGPDARTTDPNVSGPNGPTPFVPDNNVNVAMINRNTHLRYDEAGIGLGNDGRDVLSYADLANAGDQPYEAEVDREMTLNLTANMGRFMFSLDGRKFSQQPGPLLFRHNERLRLWFVNHTMMGHPMHLHGMWMQVENGRPHEKLPYKHTVYVKPGERLPVLITPVEKGDWAFHCHFVYHFDSGMFHVARVA